MKERVWHINEISFKDRIGLLQSQIPPWLIVITLTKDHSNILDIILAIVAGILPLIRQKPDVGFNPVSILIVCRLPNAIAPIKLNLSLWYLKIPSPWPLQGLLFRMNKGAQAPFNPAPLLSSQNFFLNVPLLSLPYLSPYRKEQHCIFDYKYSKSLLSKLSNCYSYRGFIPTYYSPIKKRNANVCLQIRN